MAHSVRWRPTQGPSVNPDELRLVLLGRTGAGKSATGNSILGNRRFEDGLSMSSVTKECKRESATVEGRELVLIDTPGCFDTDLTDEEQQREVIRCLALCSPGPHVFILVVPIDRFTEEQWRTVEMILEMFQEDITPYTILIFSHTDRLRGEDIEEFISRQNQKVQELVERFGRRFVAFDNTNPNPDQVRRLLRSVDQLLAHNQNRHFTNQITNQITEVKLEVQNIIEKKIQAEMAERIKKIQAEVKKQADDRWRAFIAFMNEERQESERKKKRIQGRIKQIETDIKKEEQNERPIRARLERFRASLENERENLRRLEEEEMEERAGREEKEKKDLDIWIQEEEERREREEGKNYEGFSNSYMKYLIMLVLFLLGAGSAFAPALLAILFPAAPVVEAGFTAATYLYNLLGAAEGASFLGPLSGFAFRAASVKLAAMTQCCIQ